LEQHFANHGIIGRKLFEDGEFDVQCTPSKTIEDKQTVSFI
jgi:hypothetical protein